MASAFDPLGRPLFRAFWVANVVSMVGTWMQEVGAAWWMTTLAPSPLMVALVQAATSLPTFLLAVPAGALADVVDRRRLLLFLETWMLVVAALLGALALAGLAGPWTLLALTFALGVGASLHAPAWQATIPELVPREELAAAAALGGVGLNLARAVGPALGGLVVAAAGPPAVFFLNAISFLGILAVLLRWRRESKPATVPAELLFGAMRAGLRYVRHAPELRAVLARTALFIGPGSALFALLPLLARRELGLGAAGYGGLLGALGVGAVAGAALLPRFRGRLGAGGLVAAGTAVIAAAFGILGSVRSLPLLYAAMLLAGLAWIAVLSMLNAAAQTAIPSWVRARALSVYLLVFYAGVALGSILWGVVADRFGIGAAYLVAASGLVAGLPVAARYRLRLLEGTDLSPSLHWPAPTVATEIPPDRGPVLVTVEYTIDPARAREFGEVMRRLRRIRLRDGAILWDLFVDAADPVRNTEAFVVESWAEHLRQHDRVTVADREIEKLAHSFHLGDAPPRVTHHLAAR